MPIRKPSTWQTSLRHYCLAALTQPVCVDHTVAVRLFTICLTLYLLWLPSPFVGSLLSAHTILSWVKWCRYITRTLADSNVQRRKWRRARKRLRVRCILDLNKALQDVRKPVFGQEENAKQALHQTLRDGGYWIISCRESWAETLAARTEAAVRSKLWAELKSTYTKTWQKWGAETSEMHK